MIISIQHKGLRAYYEDGNGAKLQAVYLKKIARILTSLDAVSSVADIEQLGSGVHKLTGDMAAYWSISVSANYRIVFQFDGNDVSDVDYLDYH